LTLERLTIIKVDTMSANDEPVVVEQTFQASIDAVWNAITEIGQMREWYFDAIPSFQPVVGFETQFNVRDQGRDFLHMWKLTDVVPPRMITYNWKYEGYSGDSFVVFELIEQNDGTKLRLRHQVTESFPEDIAAFSREITIEGWTYFIKNTLKAFLEKH
jgi:uncharacterized protein YndB with AHSA1/START domain